MGYFGEIIMSKSLEEIQKSWWDSKHKFIKNKKFTCHHISKSIDEWIEMLYELKKSGHISMSIIMDDDYEKVCLNFQKIVEETDEEYNDRRATHD